MDEAQFEKIVAQMMQAGAQRFEAVAIACAFEHALESKEFATKYGTKLQEALQEAINKA